MDCSLRIHHMGKNIQKLFPVDAVLTQRPLDEVFRLIRPDIHVEWDKVGTSFFFSNNRRILFLSFSPTVVISSFSWKIVYHCVLGHRVEFD